MKESKKHKITELINMTAQTHNLRVYDVEFPSPSFVKIYIDGPALHLCEKFIKSFLFLIRAQGWHDMDCEVSTPGLQRKLKKDWHFADSVGKIIKIHTARPVLSHDKKTKKTRQAVTLTGLLQECKNNTIHIKDGPRDWTVPLNIIKKANRVFEEKTVRKRGG